MSGERQREYIDDKQTSSDAATKAALRVQVEIINLRDGGDSKPSDSKLPDPLILPTGNVSALTGETLAALRNELKIAHDDTVKQEHPETTNGQQNRLLARRRTRSQGRLRLNSGKI